MNLQKWILLVEDDANDAALILRVLTTAPCPAVVVHVKDGAEALNCVYRREGFESRDAGLPSLMLLDLKMPKVDGFSVLRQIKSDRATKAIPVTVFTSSKEPADLARSYDLGTNAYVVKPMDFESLTETLQEVKTFWMNYNETLTGQTAETGPNRRRAPASLALDQNGSALEE